MSVPLWAWVATVGLIGACIAADFVFTRTSDAPRLAVVVRLSALWVGAGLAFGAGLAVWRGPNFAGQYYAGYMLEKALSVDNILVFVVLFASLAVPAQLQRRVLSFGVVGALLLRAGLIGVGGVLFDKMSWILALFGVFVLVTGVRMFRREPEVSPSRNSMPRFLGRLLPVSDSYDGDRMWTRVDGRLMATPLLVAVGAVEIADLVFATDSIPAIFGVTDDVFVVFTSNAFAVLGLRALYFVLAGLVTRFTYLRSGLALLLVLIGAKMLASPIVEIPIWVTLAAIVVVLATSVVGSIWMTRRASRLLQPSAK
jgi:tellurite resistance protein TerC